MLIHPTLKTTGPLLSRPTVSPTEQQPKAAEPKDSFLGSVGSVAWKGMKRVGKSLKPYAKSGLITAAPAIATAAAAAIGGAPAAGIALLAGTGVGMVAGAATWGKDIGILRGAATGAWAGMLSSAMGAIGGVIGVTCMAAVGAAREGILRHAF